MNLADRVRVFRNASEVRANRTKSMARGSATPLVKGMPLSVSRDLSRMPTSLPGIRIESRNRVTHRFLTHAASTGDELNAVLKASPDFGLGQAIRGLSCLLLARSELVAIAREAYLAPRAGEPGTGSASASLTRQ